MDSRRRISKAFDFINFLGMPGEGLPVRRLRSSNSMSSSSSENDEQRDAKALTNGVKHVAGKDKKNGKKEATKADPDDDGIKYSAGMKSGLKHLYSGKEDKKGRFQWQDKIPEDIGDPVENSTLR